MSEMGSILFEASLRAAALGLVVGILHVLARKRAPVLVRGLWAGTVLGMLVLPWMIIASPSLELRIPGWTAEAPSAAAPVHAIADSESAAAPSASFTGAPKAQPARAPRLDEGDVLVGLYLAGLIYMLVRLSRGLWTLRQLARGSRRLRNPDLQELVYEILPKSRVTLAVSSAVQVPLTAGFLRPKIFLPESWRSWPEDRRDAVIAHELSHVRRGDFLWIVLAELNKCIFWFHPLAWIARRNLAVLGEEVSDAEAVIRLGSRTAYARALVEISRRVGGAGRVELEHLAASMATKNELERRVDRILNATLQPSLSRPARRIGVIAITALILVVGSLELVAGADEGGGVAEGSFDQYLADLSHADPERRARAAADVTSDEARWGEAIPHLVALLGDATPISHNPRSRVQGWSSSHSRWTQPSPGETATIALASMSSLAAPALADQLAHGDPVVRRNAAWGLGELRHPRGIDDSGIDALVDRLGDPDEQVRTAVAWALGDIRVRQAIPGLIEAVLHDSHDRVRIEAAVALGEIRAAAAEEPLTRVLQQDSSWRLSRAVRYALSEIHDHGY